MAQIEWQEECELNGLFTSKLSMYKKYGITILLW